MEKTKWKRMIDLLMTIMLLLLMCYQLIGEAAHEWIGAFMFMLFIFHQVLNGKWHQSLLKGRYTAMRTLQTFVNALLFLVMICQAVSGVALSRHLFVFLDFDMSRSVARVMHLLGSYWGFVLMSFHIGLHWNMMLGPIKKRLSDKKRVVVCLQMLAYLVAAYGIFAMIKRDLPDYMFLTTQFVFFDFEEPLVFFLLDYMAIMGLFIFAAHCTAGMIKKVSGRFIADPHLGHKAIMEY